MDSTLQRLCNAVYTPEGRGECIGTIHQFDCWGLVMAVFNHFGVQIPDYTEHPDNFDAVKKQYLAASTSPLWIRIEQPKAPCLVAMTTVHPAVCNHFGVYIGNGVFVHIQKERGVHTDRIDSAPWQRFIHSYWRYTDDYIQ